MQICLNLAFKGAYLIGHHISAKAHYCFGTLQLSSNYIAASVNTDYNEALIVLKSIERGKFQLHFCARMTSQFIVTSLVFHCSNVHFGVSFLQ